MDCPKCNADMEILDYSEDNRESYGFPEAFIRTWECKCPKCSYKGTFIKYYECKYEEWDYVE